MTEIKELIGEGRTQKTMADVAVDGQLWVKNTNPNELWFTDGDGTDHQVAFV